MIFLIGCSPTGNANRAPMGANDREWGPIKCDVIVKITHALFSFLSIESFSNSVVVYSRSLAAIRVYSRHGGHFPTHTCFNG